MRGDGRDSRQGGYGRGGGRGGYSGGGGGGGPYGGRGGYRGDGGSGGGRGGYGRGGGGRWGGDRRGGDRDRPRDPPFDEAAAIAQLQIPADVIAEKAAAAVEAALGVNPDMPEDDQVQLAMKTATKMLPEMNTSWRGPPPDTLEEDIVRFSDVIRLISKRHSHIKGRVAGAARKAAKRRKAAAAAAAADGGDGEGAGEGGDSADPSKPPTRPSVASATPTDPALLSSPSSGPRDPCLGSPLAGQCDSAGEGLSPADSPQAPPTSAGIREKLRLVDEVPVDEATPEVRAVAEMCKLARSVVTTQDRDILEQFMKVSALGAYAATDTAAVELVGAIAAVALPKIAHPTSAPYGSAVSGLALRGKADVDIGVKCDEDYADTLVAEAEATSTASVEAGGPPDGPLEPPPVCSEHLDKQVRDWFTACRKRRVVVLRKLYDAMLLFTNPEAVGAKDTHELADGDAEERKASAAVRVYRVSVAAYEAAEAERRERGDTAGLPPPLDLADVPFAQSSPAILQVVALLRAAVEAQSDDGTPSPYLCWERVRLFDSVRLVDRARTPVIKARLRTGVDLDITAFSELGQLNSRLLRAYTLTDPRLHVLAVFLKYWAARRGISSAAGGGLSSYSFILTMIAFFQSRGLPCLQEISDVAHLYPDGVAVDRVAGPYTARFITPSKPHICVAVQGTLSQLLKAFFTRYSVAKTNPKAFDMDSRVVTVSGPSTLSRFQLTQQDLKDNEEGHGLPREVLGAAFANANAAVLDPFEWDFNPAHTLRRGAFIDLKFEYKRGFVFMGHNFPMAKIAAKVQEIEETQLGAPM